jgi:hypothetical protein
MALMIAMCLVTLVTPSGAVRNAETGTLSYKIRSDFADCGQVHLRVRWYSGTPERALRGLLNASFPSHETGGGFDYVSHARQAEVTNAAIQSLHDESGAASVSAHF